MIDTEKYVYISYDDDSDVGELRVFTWCWLTGWRTPARSWSRDRSDTLGRFSFPSSPRKDEWSRSVAGLVRSLHVKTSRDKTVNMMKTSDSWTELMISILIRFDFLLCITRKFPCFYLLKIYEPTKETHKTISVIHRKEGDSPDSHRRTHKHTYI